MTVSAEDEVLDRIEEEEDETEFKRPPLILLLLQLLLVDCMMSEEVEGEGELGDTAKVPALLKSDAAEDRWGN